MDELISKRAVIEAIEKARANVGHNLEHSIGKSIIEILDDVGRDVNRLPSEHGTNLAEVGTDCISRQQAIDTLENTKTAISENGERYIAKQNAIMRIDALPSAQPERIKGRWVESDALNRLMKNLIAKGETWRVCDKCGAGFMIGYQYECDKLYHETFHNFCPNCGADMRGEQDE